MESSRCEDSGSLRNDFFVTAPNSRDNSGPPQALKPEYCPKGADRSDCHIRVHGHRHRKTGPEHPLLILHCAKHTHYFTVYPPGFVPYSRSRWFAVDDSGRPLPRGCCRLRAWRQTPVEAVLLLASGEPSPRSFDGRPHTRSIGRALQWAARLLGLTTELLCGQRIADHLGLGIQRLSEARTRWANTRSWRARALIVVELVEAVPREGPFLLRWFRAGWEAGLLKAAWWWQPHGYLAMFPVAERT